MPEGPDRDAIRDAVESILQSGSYQIQTVQSPENQERPNISHSQSINTIPPLHPDYVISGDLLAGQSVDGKMSNVRRSFCLIVAFDLLFISLLWLICLMSNGENIMKALSEQVYHYTIQASLFDIVMCAICRFTVLLLFYGLLLVNHWFVIALSTAVSCGFLIGKVFLYNWSGSNHPTFEVPLVLFSFVLSWGEAWFLDSRVFPQEINARRYLISITDSERAPLIRSYVNGIPSVCTESVGNFYSPLGSPEGSLYRFSQAAQRRYAPVNFSIAEQEAFNIQGATTLQNAWNIVQRTDWVEKKTSGDDVVYAVTGADIGKVYKIKGCINISPKVLFEELFYKVEAIPQWNPSLSESYKVQVFDEHTDITYQISAPNVIVSSRDFVTLRHWDLIDNCYVIAWRPTEHPNVPKDDRYVRGKNVIGCFVMQPVAGDPDKCNLQYMLDIDLNMWLPTYIREPAIYGMMFDFLKCMRQRVQRVKEAMQK